MAETQTMTRDEIDALLASQELGSAAEMELTPTNEADPDPEPRPAAGDRVVQRAPRPLVDRSDLRIRSIDGPGQRVRYERIGRGMVDVPVSQGDDGQPEYQIEIHLGGRDELNLVDLDAALRHAQQLLR